MSETNLTKDEWDQRVIELNGSILQSWDWGDFQKALGFGLHRFSGADFINQTTEIPLAAGKKYLYSGRGPLGNISSARSDIDTLARKDHKIVFARIEPSEAPNLPKAAKDTQPTHYWLLDLEQSEEEILARMKPKTRYNINLAQRKGVTVREGSEKDLLDAYKLLLETSRRNKFSLHPQDYYWRMWECLQPQALRLLVAEYQGLPLACMFLTLFGTTATYAHGGSSSRMQQAMAPYLLHWEAIKLSKQLGYKYYDFGGIAPAGETDHPWAGITRFKKSFGGFELIFPGSFEIIYAPLWYNVYRNARTLRNLIRK